MMFLLLFLAFAGVAAALWVQGFWSSAISFVNMILAGLIATNFFEPVADMIESYGAASWTYLLDFVVLWLLFFVAFAGLRAICDGLSQVQVKFDKPVEMAGRSVFAVLAAWVFVCFLAFSLQLAPLNSEDPLGAFGTPKSNAFIFAAPDRLWQKFMFDRSRGALSRAHFSSAPPHPNDQALNVETFDPQAVFSIKYHDRRKKYVAQPELRVVDAAAAPAAAQ
jgi:hypothetical protein